MKNSHWPLTLMNTLVSLLQMAVPLLFARMFSVDEIGNYKLFFFYLQLFPVISLFTGTVHGIYYWSGLPGGRAQACRNQVWTLINAYAGFWLVALVAGSAVLARWMDWPLDRTVAFALAAPLAFGSSFYEESQIARGHVVHGAVFRFFWETLRSVLQVLVAWKTRDIQSVFWVHIGVLGLKQLSATILGMSSGHFRWQWDRKIAREILNYVLPVSFAGILGTISSSADQMLLSRTLVPGEFALYTMGCLVVPPLFALEQSINQLLVPRLSQAFSAQDSTLARKFYRDSVAELGRFLIPSAVGLAIFAEPIIELLFTQKFIAAAPILRVYALVYVLAIAPAEAVPRGQGNSRWTLRWLFVIAPISAAIVGIATPVFGVFGALSGTLAAGLVYRAAGISHLKLKLKWHLREALPLGKLAAYTLTSLALGAGALLARPYFEGNLSWFFVAGGIFSVIYGSLFLLSKKYSLLRILRKAGLPA